MIWKPERLWEYVRRVLDGSPAVKQTLEKTDGQISQARESVGRAAVQGEDSFRPQPVELNEPVLITVMVACATRERQRVEEVQLEPGATIEQSISVSGIARRFPDLDLSRCRVGIHGSVRPSDHPVQEGDRVEIYRPVEATS